MRQSDAVGQARRGPRTRWLRLGPGLVLALILSAVTWLREQPLRQADTGRPVVERVALPGNRSPRTPDVADLLAHAGELRLTPLQRTQLKQLVRQWAPESAERQQAMREAAGDFARFMARAQHHEKQGAADLYRQAAEGSARTSEWLARKAYFWQRGLAELTPAQRRRAGQVLAWSSGSSSLQPGMLFKERSDDAQETNRYAGGLQPPQ
jgi:hypothetical protein